MQDFNRELSELRGVLEKADVGLSWKQGYSYQTSDGCRVVLDLVLEIRGDAHARPTGAQFKEAEISFSMTVGNDGGFGDIVDLQAQIVIDALDVDAQLLRFALHFDKHDVSQVSTDLHSHYHWQLGGNRLDECEIKGLLVLEGPRFPSHPLDPILLLDFVLGHFHGEVRSRLLNDPTLIAYSRLLHSSQRRYVAPFFEEIVQAMSKDPFVGTQLWPALCAPA